MSRWDLPFAARVALAALCILTAYAIVGWLVGL